MAAINLISGALSDPACSWKLETEKIKACIDIAKRTAALIEEEDKNDLTPSDKDVIDSISQIFKSLNNKPSTRSAIVATLVLKGIGRSIAEYMVSRAEALSIIKPKREGSRIDYTLA